ncbi:hypothetical protein GF325_06945, partial [Candidatus Bathyarchaeota archaeon]|nr:hypothetical protein [Candidatus Bathyarchaeota archaeon]
MTFCNVTIDRTEKDRFLNELSSYKRVHIKKSERVQVSEKSKDDALLLTLIQELERETKSLQVELDISDKTLDNMPVNEKVHFEATDFKDLVQGVSEEIHFYLNRVYELKKFIVKARIELENVHMLEICYKLLDTININKYNITFLDELELRLFTTFSKNEENLHELFNQAVFPNIYRTMSVSKERIAFFTLYP